jgi:hypothetical protein
VKQLVEVLRSSLDSEDLTMQLGPIMGSVLLPVSGTDPAELGLSAPELRALGSVLTGGACEGLSVADVLKSLSEERIARESEAAFALLMGLSVGILQAPGF